ncbi:Sec-independent protein translocase protein TatB [Acinetobacter puyangensis]|uniref:Sec-independent protein translocase protein TatB n=1 Tax=Acinetobacter puyangensis TaxID=1096779 RepID=UPI003A4D5ED7
MFNIGMGELLLFLVIALIVLGPEQLLQAIRYGIKFYNELKKLIQQVQNDVEKELKLSELQELMTSKLNEVQIKEQELQLQLERLNQEIIELNKPKSKLRSIHYISITSLTIQQLRIPYLPLKSDKGF